MSDFTSNFWSIYVAGITLAGIIACALLLWLTSRKKIESAADNTTGHVWDVDLREMNNPMPRWWMWLFVITIVFAFAYLAAYPAWAPSRASWGGRKSVSTRQKLTRPMPSCSHCMHGSTA